MRSRKFRPLIPPSHSQKPWLALSCDPCHLLLGHVLPGATCHLLVVLFIIHTGPGLTSNRYYPTPVKGRLAILYNLLAMFHPRPFLLTRFGPQGTVACVRAENQDYLDIVFRFAFFCLQCIASILHTGTSILFHTGSLNISFKSWQYRSIPVRTQWGLYRTWASLVNAIKFRL